MILSILTTALRSGFWYDPHFQKRKWRCREVRRQSKGFKPRLVSLPSSWSRPARYSVPEKGAHWYCPKLWITTGFHGVASVPDSPLIFFNESNYSLQTWTLMWGLSRYWCKILIPLSLHSLLFIWCHHGIFQFCFQSILKKIGELLLAAKGHRALVRSISFPVSHHRYVFSSALERCVYVTECKNSVHEALR